MWNPRISVSLFQNESSKTETFISDKNEFDLHGNERVAEHKTRFNTETTATGKLPIRLRLPTNTRHDLADAAAVVWHTFKTFCVTVSPAKQFVRLTQIAKRISP